ncbi:DEAD-box ATP-dependent RNA helicase DeaD (= CshA), partial [hydrothermal vent metagenome]
MTEPQEGIASFGQLDLGWEIQKALEKMGYLKPTPIQAMAIPAALEGRDIFGQARTGTGKTAAFAIPVLEGLTDRRPRYPKALILAPTRELATQIQDEMRKIGEFKKTRVMAVVGGR